MYVSEPMIDIFLQPGEFYFGDRETRIRTLLGSCVSITLWHPQALIGGMCHYMLPSRPNRAAGQPLDGRYADEALEMLLREVRLADTEPGEYQVKMFGAGRQMDGVGDPALSVADRNLEMGLDLLERSGLRLAAKHLGGSGPRQIIFDISTGVVWLSHVDTTRDAVLA